MRTITLARYWNPGNSFYKPGDVVEVEESTAEWLERTGAAAKPQAKAVPQPRDTVKKPAEDDDEAPEAAVTAGGEHERPARTASIDVWREFAEAQGITTKGLSKQELIAATK